jgi:hypothetical protein
MGAINGDGDRLPAEQMHLDTGGWYSTGYPGSPSPDQAPATAGPVVGRPVVSAPFGSSQLPENMPRLPVTSGDTSGFSDDLPVHESFLVPSHSDVTGAGKGRVI